MRFCQPHRIAERERERERQTDRQTERGSELVNWILTTYIQYQGHSEKEGEWERGKERELNFRF